MTHSDAGNYAGKHQSQSIPAELRKMINAVLSEKRLSCKQAHQIAADSEFSPSDVGRAADLMEIRLSGCQLGLFGHGKKEKIKAAASLDTKLEKILQKSLIDGALPCRAAWQIAADFNLQKTDITAACEAGKIKITPCQLGAF
ncbi:MAG: hypothetical protein DRH03_03685 [Deltaproteobacteria bacterium]|nr:MAG: hypothetical protein DRH03_03685 [Deltaproteobacteria bacterium]